MNRRLEVALVGLAIFLWCLLAAWRLDALPVPVFDEKFHARAGVEIAAGRLPHEVSHPPLVKDAIALSAIVTGTAFDPSLRDWEAGSMLPYPPGSAVSWRLPSIIMAGVALGMLYGLARSMALGPLPAAAAMLLLMLDGCFLVHARTGQTNVYEVALVLAATLGAWRARKDLRWLWLAGAAIGLAIASRWSALAPYVLIGGWLAWGWRDDPRRLLRLAAAWLPLPVLVYVATYLPLIALRPGGLTSMAAWQVGFVDAQLTIIEFHSLLREYHAYQSPWWSWPLVFQPVWYAFTFRGAQFMVVWAIGNFAIWWLSVPVLLAAARRGWTGDAHYGLLALVGLGSWGAWAFQPRSMTFMHYFLATIPYACIMLADIGEKLWRGRSLAGGPSLFEPKAGRMVVVAFGVVVVAWFAFYYPLLTGMPISKPDLMRHILVPSWM